MNSSSPESGRKYGFVPLLLTGTVVLILAAFWVARTPPLNKRAEELANQQAKKQSAEKKFSSEISLKLITLRNQAIADLENHEFATADAILIEILRLLPNDPFGPRNLAICRQLALESTENQRSPDEFAKKGEQALESVNESKSKEPDSYIPRLIAARVASKLDQTDLAFAELREAVRLGPDAVGPSYDLFQMLQFVPDDKYQEESFQALRSTYQKEPQNLFVIKDWLPLLAQRKSPEFSETMKQARSTIAPFVDLIKVHTRIDLNQTIDAALQDASEGNWTKVQRSMTVLKNLIVSEAARDKRYVILDSLEYILFDYSSETRARLDLTGTVPSAPSNPVHFLFPDDLEKWPTLGSADKADLARDDLAITDFDLDGRPDILVLQGQKLAAWGQKNEGDAWTVLANADIEGSFTGLLAFDFDDDVDMQIKGLISADQSGKTAKDASGQVTICQAADPDAILYGPAGLKLLENVKDPDTKQRTFIAKSGGAEFDELRDVQAAAVADFDSDGDLDLAVLTPNGLKIFSNRGNLTFDETTSRSQLPPVGSRVLSMATVDWDKDTDIDLLLAFPEGGGLLENVRHGQFRYRALSEFSMFQHATSLCIGDFDGNASWDVITSTAEGAKVVLTDRTSAGVVVPRQTISLTSSATRSAQVGDFDNDGFLDVILVHDEGSTIHLSTDGSQFVNAEDATNNPVKKIAFVTVADLDRDGDLDLVVSQSGKIFSLSNQCRESDNPNHGFIELRLSSERIRSGETNWDKRVNHVNLGGTIEVKSGNRYQARMVNSPTTHFGLGANQQAEVARILWTNGIPTNYISPSTHESVCIEQKLLGSCPYLYAWNGERFEFVTDLLWNAPLGLKFAERIVAPWREWEYLKIDGRQLKAIDKEYQLRITAELWEAEYFDQCKLFAIDHPEGTEIYTNEKVGPPELAEHKIHTVRSRRWPVSARDSHGRDVRDQILDRDGYYTKTFDKRLAQGFTEEHFLELDLGEFPKPRNITLFLTGWMYPGSTSLRVQLSQNPETPMMKSPSLWVPDAKGEWREIRSFMGFPGGKTKTIAVDLSDVFQGPDHRLRIVSTMELFWDQAFFTVDDKPVEMKQTELPLIRANLVDRGGVSFRSWPASGNGPDQFEYARLVTGEQWPAMSGRFTRFGDVLPLLRTRDDQLVVIGSGDEIQLAFTESADTLPKGWVRDFVIYTVGWDKDADQNTVYGDTVEPLPFEGMTDYAHINGEPRPHDESYLKYLETYQTRTRNPTRFWKSIFQSTGSTP